MSWCILYLGEIVDAYDSPEEANVERLRLFSDVKAGKLPNFLDPDDIDDVNEFTVERRQDVS